MSAGSPIRFAWFVVALLFPVALLNYLDRQMLATMKGSMVADIPSMASRADWGFALGSFKWTYAVLSPVGGYLADRFSRRHVICVSLLAWTVVTWMTGHVSTFHELVATRALMGISEAFYIPAALALITEHHLGATRSKAVGVHQAGISRPDQRATGYGLMNLFSTSCGGFGDWGFGFLRDRQVPLNLIFGAFAGIALLSLLIVLLIRPGATEPTSPP